MGALPFVIQLLSSLPALIQAGIDVTGLIQQSSDAIKRMQAEKRDPTPEEWDALNSRIKALRDELHDDGGQT